MSFERRAETLLRAAVVLVGFHAAGACKKKEDKSMSGGVATCPTSSEQGVELGGEGRVNEKRIDVDKSKPTIYLRSAELPKETYLTVYGERPLTSGANAQYDKLLCMDSKNSGKFNEVKLGTPSGTDLYKNLRFKVWLESRPTLSVQVKREQDRRNGEMPMYDTLKLVRSSGQNIDDIVKINVEQPPPIDAGAGTLIDAPGADPAADGAP